MATRDHDWWRYVIAERYLPAIGPARTATLSIDGESLAELAELDAREARASLSATVRREVGAGFSLFRYASLTRSWWRGDAEKPPPALPLLALTVLAATEMGTVPGIPSHNFYVPFRRLLDSADQLDGAPGDFTEYIQELWKSLDHWTDDVLVGERGWSSFKAPRGHFTFIGYSLEQALILAPDRRLLRQFVHQLEDSESRGLPDEEIRNLLVAWARRFGSAGDRLLRLATDRRLAVLCDSVINAEWTRVLAPAERRDVTGRVEIVFGDRPFELGLAPERPDNSPDEIEARVLGGPRVSLVAVPGTERWFSRHSLAGLAPLQAASRGLTIRTSNFDLLLEPAPAFVLRYNDELGAFVSCPRLVYDEQLLFLVQADLAESVRSYLDSIGSTASMRTEYDQYLGPNWKLLGPFSLSTRPSIDPPPALMSLFPWGVRGPRGRLVGGLAVGPFTRTYLTGGAPNLDIPPGARSVAVEHGATRDLIHVEGHRASTVALATTANLEGTHIVRINGQELRFEMVDHLLEGVPPGMGSVRTDALGNVAFSGYVPFGDANDEIVEPLVIQVRPGETAYALGAAPSSVRPLTTPIWIEQLADGPLSWSSLEVEATFEVAWAVIVKADGSAIAYPVRPLPVREAIHGSAPLWHRLIRTAQLASELDGHDKQRWQSYVNASRRVR